MTRILTRINGFLWGAPALLLFLTVGLFLSLRLGFAQLRLLPMAWKQFCGKLMPNGEKSGFRELCTALAATVGTGNLVGVAGAICLGGPGAIFWMWLCGILGMASKYAEAVLAIRFRLTSEDGFRGGPMYIMEQAMGKCGSMMAWFYSIFGLVASFGIGNAAQINAVVSGIGNMMERFGMKRIPGGELLLGLLLAFLIGTLFSGGAGRIGEATERLVPFAAAGYILLCCGVLMFRADRILQAFSDIFRGAFSPAAVTGGMLGSGFQALRIGCSRGVFTNEAGMGTAAIAHSGANVDQPVRQGLMGIVEVFLDTIVICTMTALVILTSGVPIPYGSDAGAILTEQAFASVYGAAASVFLAVALCLFAVATVLGWGLYGARCAQYLFGNDIWKGYVISQTVMVVFSATADTGLIWQFSEMFNGLMAIPNLITLAVLSPEVVRLTKDYKKAGN